jgi:hypothetical protein
MPEEIGRIAGLWGAHGAVANLGGGLGGRRRTNLGAASMRAARDAG